MISKKDLEKAIEVCSSTGWGCSAQDKARQLLKERDVYRQMLIEQVTYVRKHYVEGWSETSFVHIPEEVDAEAQRLLDIKS